MIPNKQQALELLKKYNSDPFHIKHGLIVSGVMEYFANELGYADEADHWAVVGLLHKTFKPEFLNRLSGTVVFHDMDKQMATLILQKKLRELESKLQTRHVTMELSPDAFEYILKEGFTPEYGAREMDRVISQKLKPLLMREILFGNLKQGGNITIGIKDGGLSVG